MSAAEKREGIERALVHHVTTGAVIDYSPPGGGRATWVVHLLGWGPETLTTPQAHALCLGLAAGIRAAVQPPPEPPSRPATKPSAVATDAAALIALITPAPGAEAVYEDFTARVAAGLRKVETGGKRKARKAKAMRYEYPSQWPGAAPGAVVSIPGGEASDDYAWRTAHPALDQFLAHCEVAGRILSRHAAPGGLGQVLTFPSKIGGLKPGVSVTFTADEVREWAKQIALGTAGRLAATPAAVAA